MRGPVALALAGALLATPALAQQAPPAEPVIRLPAVEVSAAESSCLRHVSTVPSRRAISKAASA